MVRSFDVYEPTCGEAVSTTVIRALAAATDKDPIDMDLQLYDAVDPDALDALYDSSDDSGPSPEISFTLGEYHVTIDESRDVQVSPESTEPPLVEGPARPTTETPTGPTLTGRAVSDE